MEWRWRWTGDAAEARWPAGLSAGAGGLDYRWSHGRSELPAAIAFRRESERPDPAPPIGDGALCVLRAVWSLDSRSHGALCGRGFGTSRSPAASAHWLRSTRFTSSKSVPSARVARWSMSPVCRVSAFVSVGLGSDSSHRYIVPVRTMPDTHIAPHHSVSSRRRTDQLVV